MHNTHWTLPTAHFIQNTPQSMRKSPVLAFQTYPNSSKKNPDKSNHIWIKGMLVKDCYKKSNKKV